MSLDLCQLLIPGAEPADQYLKTFHWNKVKYRADKPLGEIIDTLQKVTLELMHQSSKLKHTESLTQEVSSIDNDVKNKYNQYNQVKTSLVALQRKQTYDSIYLYAMR